MRIITNYYKNNYKNILFYHTSAVEVEVHGLLDWSENHQKELEVSRLLAQNPNAPIHCHKQDEICYLYGAKNATCCNNKCIDLAYDKHKCGACKKHCKFTQTCCRGQCVDTNYEALWRVQQSV